MMEDYQTGPERKSGKNVEFKKKAVAKASFYNNKDPMQNLRQRADDVAEILKKKQMIDLDPEQIIFSQSNTNQ